MDIKTAKKLNIPNTFGVYLFINKNEDILYIGKAINLRKRILDHFKKNVFPDSSVIPQINRIEFIITKDEKTALILENKLIKKYLPKYNTQWKDDKNYTFVAITREDFPLIYTTHQTQEKNADFIGPFVSAKELKRVLSDLRKILPYRTCKTLPKKTCLYADLGLCLGYCIHHEYKSQYQRIIQILRALLEVYQGQGPRLEAYDISNLNGSLTAGSMVVFEKNKKSISQYRRFKIKTIIGQNDTASLREVLQRRLKHHEWPMPKIFILDGGKSQLKSAYQLRIPVLGITKTKRQKNKASLCSPFSKKVLNLHKLPREIAEVILQIRDESHRFALSYNKKQRIKKLTE